MQIRQVRSNSVFSAPLDMVRCRASVKSVKEVLALSGISQLFRVFG